MQTFKYFNQEGNTYIKKTQVALYSITSLFLLAIVGFVLYKNPNPGAKWVAIMFGLLGLVLLLRCTAKLTFNTTTRIISIQPSILSKPREFRFEDFQNFLISKQTMLITLNATASMIMEKDGKTRTLLLHQALIYTKPLQKVTDEAALIMGITQS